MRTLAISVVTLSLIGCSVAKPAESDAANVDSPSRATVRSPEKLPNPQFEKRTSLKLLRNGGEVRVGDPIEDALTVFKPDRNGFRIADMPPGWKDSRFQCNGWEAGSTGFGTITFEDRIVLALYHEDRVNENRLREVMDDYDSAIPTSATQLTGSRVRYWFWEDGSQRLMICAVQPPNDGLNITVALGEATTMNYFGMSPTLADKDRVIAETIFQQGIERKKASKD